MNLVFKLDKNKTIYLTSCRRISCDSKAGSKFQLRSMPQTTGRSSNSSMGIPFERIVDKDEDTIVTEKVPNFVLNSTSYIKQKPLVLKLDKSCFACLSSISKFLITIS